MRPAFCTEKVFVLVVSDLRFRWFSQPLRKTRGPANGYDQREYKKKDVEWQPDRFMMSGMSVNRTEHHYGKHRRSADGQTRYQEKGR